MDGTPERDQAHRREERVGRPHGPERRENQAVGQLLATDQRDVVGAEHREAHGHDHAHPASRVPNGERRADQDEYNAGRRDRELLVDFDQEPVLPLESTSDLGLIDLVLADRILRCHEPRRALEGLRSLRAVGAHGVFGGEADQLGWAAGAEQHFDERGRVLSAQLSCGIGDLHA